jgi:hypothetical protein
MREVGGLLGSDGASWTVYWDGAIKYSIEIRRLSDLGILSAHSQVARVEGLKP